MPHPLIEAIEQSWQIIPKGWPLQSLVPTNPLQGLEDLPIEEALSKASVFFTSDHPPSPIENINRETIKWLQAFCDQGQAKISMPNRHQGLYASWRVLACHDAKLHQHQPKKQAYLASQPASALDAIRQTLDRLKIRQDQQALFLTLMLTTLPGWAAYIKFCLEDDASSPAHATLREDYLALRVIITASLWEEAEGLLTWHAGLEQQSAQELMQPWIQEEQQYLKQLLPKLHQEASTRPSPKAQWLFCIDPRSGAMRTLLEEAGDETFGCAGFFALPVCIQVNQEAPVKTCPNFVHAKHCVAYKTPSTLEKWMRSSQQTYEYMKNSSLAAFLIVDLLGWLTLLWMLLKTLMPRLAYSIRDTLKKEKRGQYNSDIPLSDQCTYAEHLLRSIGLTKGFARHIILCGHRSQNENQADYANLNCGACFGQSGIHNARIMASILNNPCVRKHLENLEIHIPKESVFLSAEHNTSTDAIGIDADPIDSAQLHALKQRCAKAEKANSIERLRRLGVTQASPQAAQTRSMDWAEIRTEWGLAQNASFIIAPRQLTHRLNLEHRAFLHSYDATEDPDGAILRSIMQGPLLIAQWINHQYLFSALNNKMYGQGSKITQNITGKFALMQGNASDLMHGYALESLFIHHRQPYHIPMRLITIIQTPLELLQALIAQDASLKKRFANGWIKLVCLDPKAQRTLFLTRELTWTTSYPKDE